VELAVPLVKVYVNDTPLPYPPVQVNVTFGDVYELDNVIAVGVVSVILPVVLPLTFVAVIISAQDEPVNEVNVAVPVDELDGVAETPLMVYVVVTATTDVPPDHETVNPFVERGETDDGIILVIGDGASIAIAVILPDVMPVWFAAVIINVHDVPANEVKVAVPVDELDGLTEIPLMVYVVVTATIEVPPDQEAVNPLDTTLVGIMFVIGGKV
jgi:hypothetical protein